MLKKVFASIIIVGFLCNFSFASDEFALFREERIGNLRIDTSETEVKKNIHCALKRGPDKLWGADGLHHQKWEYKSCGTSLDMVSEKKGAPKLVASIRVTALSTFSTKKGVRIGSTEEEVIKAYEPYWNKEGSERGKAFVAGSIYGGLILSIKNGQVSAIFLGAAAE